MSANRNNLDIPAKLKADSPSPVAATILRTFEQAKEHHRDGRLTAAEMLYRQILNVAPDHAGAHHLLGMAASQGERHEEAFESIGRAIAIDPTSAVFHLSLGQAVLALGRSNEAIAAYRRATELGPHIAETWFGLGVALQAGGQVKAAIGVYRRLISIAPRHVEAHNNLGSALEYCGEIDKAISVYRRALEFAPDRAATYNNLGSALHRRARFEEAVAACRRSVQLDPNFAGGWNNLGLALSSVKRPDEAVAALNRALDLHPDSAEAWYNLANARKDRGELVEAVAANRRAIFLRSDWPEGHINLGNALQALGQFAEAADCYRRALDLRPDDIEAHNNLGTALQNLGRADAAIGEFSRCIALRPEFHVAHCNLGNALKDVGRIEEAVDCYARAVALCPADAVSHSNLVFSAQYHPGYSAADILRECRRFDAMHAAGLRDRDRRHANVLDPDRRLRIGYVGADFREHCQSLFTIPLLSHHDREQFEVFCYANVLRPDAVTERIKSLAHVWRSIVGKSDADVAEQVRADRIDVLVDLTMHMSNGRPLLMARKPAPVQVAYLAYPGTTGLSAVDYRLTDQYLDPPGDDDAHYSEKTLRLPETFWCYDPLTNRPNPNVLPAIGAKRITFGCLNNFCKVTAETLAIWARVLETVANSRLLLLCPLGEHRGRVCEHFRRQNVDPARIEFVEPRPRRSYLDLYEQIDLSLDTVPYNGHTTSLDSLWMGVPVVTRIGRTVVGRAGLSQLTNLGLPDLAAASDEEFVAIAAGLARDLPRLAELRAGLRSRMEQSPLMQAARFARHLEAAYREAWREWCRSR